MSNEVAKTEKKSILVKFSEAYGVEPEKMLKTLKQTAFKSKQEISNEQMMALLMVADQYKLNPFTKEIYAFPNRGGVEPILSVDGWIKIIQSHPNFDGIQFSYSESRTHFNGKEIPEYCEATIYRKDQSQPTTVIEFFDEVKRSTDTWNSHPMRMLRHKTLIQCARIAFGFSGIYDQDEAERIVESKPQNDGASAIHEAIKSEKKEEVIDVEYEAEQNHEDSEE